jgi:hypothetical protein
MAKKMKVKIDKTELLKKLEAESLAEKKENETEDVVYLWTKCMC